MGKWQERRSKYSWRHRCCTQTFKTLNSRADPDTDTALTHKNIDKILLDMSQWCGPDSRCNQYPVHKVFINNSDCRGRCLQCALHDLRLLQQVQRCSWPGDLSRQNCQKYLDCFTPQHSSHIHNKEEHKMGLYFYWKYLTASSKLIKYLLSQNHWHNVLG